MSESRPSTTAWAPPPKGATRMIESVFAPMADGVNLAMQLWLPADAEAHPAPVVLESIPYRKRDRYRGYDLYWGQMLAQYGIAYARLDVRGSGNSGGVLADEYLALEQADGAAAIAWLARQSWCNGSVGMRGVSWGGFSALQTAALAPPALKAIMPMCASDMRYTEDAHYVGGVFALTGLKWATSFKVVAAGPPDPLNSRGGLEKPLAGTVGGDGADRRAVAAPPDQRRLLATRIDRRRLGRDPLSGLRRGRAGGPLRLGASSPAGRSRGPLQGDPGALASWLSVSGRAWPRSGLGLGGGALVAPLADR